MGGITTEPRLTRLLRLRDQLDAEIATEQAAEDRRKAATAARAAARAAEEQEAADARRRSVSPSTVRAWAVKYGHTTAVRGRLSTQLIDLYLDAHPDHARSIR